MIRVTIIARDGEHDPEVREFLSGPVSIGRLARNDLVLVSSRVSSVHARALESDQGVTLIDNNSTNGTFVNGVMVRGPVTVGPEDQVEVGSFTLHFERGVAEEAYAAEPMIGEGEDEGEGDGEIIPSEFDDLAAEEPAELAEPDLFGAEDTPVDVLSVPEQAVEMFTSRGTMPDERAPWRATAGVPSGEPGAGLSGAFERTFVALAPSPLAERTEAVALACARDAVEQCCPELGPRQRRQWSEWIAQEAVRIGPLTDLLADPPVSEVLVVGATSIEVRRDGVRTRHPSHFSCARALLLALDRLIGANPTEAHPTVEGVTDENVAVFALGAPLVHNGPLVILSRPQAGPRSLADLAALQQIGGVAVEALVSAVSTGANVLVCAPPGLDISEWVAAIANEVPQGLRLVAVHRGRISRHLGERAILVDAARDIATALRAGLRMRPDSLIVHELGGAEAVDLCASARRGGGSTIASLVASSPESALARVQAMVAFGEPRDPAVLRAYVAGCFDLILALREGPNGRVVADSLAEIRHAHAGELIELYAHHE